MTDAMPDTITAWVEHWVDRQPDGIWLRDRKGEEFIEWSWEQAAEEAYAIAAWLESTAGGGPQHCAILSRNRAHWSLADLGIIASGNVTVPLFTTLPPETVRYILAFAEVQTLFLGESENWERVCEVVPDSVTIIKLPGVETSRAHVSWQEIREQYRGRTPGRTCHHDQLVSIIFTSGTTGRPKGVMHTHDSMLIPMWRCRDAFNMTEHPRFLSYLPLSHVAERQAV